jgi:hypothetical protein
MAITSAFRRDANSVPITSNGLTTKKTITFAGATADAWGNDGGALDGAAIFTVTGLVFFQVIADCDTFLTGATATVEVGITGDTAIFMPTETATQIDAGQIWLNSASNDTYFEGGAEQEAVAGNIPKYILNGNDVLLTVTTADVETGVLDFYAIWTPISDDGDVVDSGN